MYETVHSILNYIYLTRSSNLVITRDIARALAVALIVTTLKTQLNNLWVADADGFLHNYGAIIHTWVADQDPVNVKRLEP